MLFPPLTITISNVPARERQNEKYVNVHVNSLTVMLTIKKAEHNNFALIIRLYYFILYREPGTEQSAQGGQEQRKCC